MLTTPAALFPDDDVRRSRSSLKGNVLEPDSAGYEAARHIFNGMIDRQPGLIAQPADTADVQKCVNFAREHNLLVSVKGGGHAASGHSVCEGGLMIDLALLKSIKVDPTAQTATAGGGVNWGEFDAATQEHGLAVTGGRNPTTGIAGLTLGSGSGWLERKLGYTVDNLLGVEIVTADGKRPAGQRGREPGAVLGTARRRRQLRHRHRVHVQAAQDRPDRLRRACSASRGSWRSRSSAPTATSSRPLRTTSVARWR